MRIQADSKIVGWILLLVGLALIVSTVYLMVSIYTGEKAPPELFNIKSITISLPAGEGNAPIEVELVQGEQVSRAANISLWTMLMLFVASAGSRIGGLGVKLIREIKVEVKRED